MTQTTHSELMNDMDRITQELVRLTTAFGTICAERDVLRDTSAIMSKENVLLKVQLERARQEADDERSLYGQTVDEISNNLKNEMDYADSLHDSLSEMKMTLLRVNGELTNEKLRYKNLYHDVYSGQISAGMDDPAYIRSIFATGPTKKILTPWQMKSEELAAEKELTASLRAEILQLQTGINTIAAQLDAEKSAHILTQMYNSQNVDEDKLAEQELEEEKEKNTVLIAKLKQCQEIARAESDRLRFDMATMYRLRDETRLERDQLASELMDLIRERDSAIKQFEQLKAEYDAHADTLSEFL